MEKSINTLRTVEEIFARYEELGFYVVPVAHKGKAPLLDPAKYASNSAKQMLAWHNTKKFKGCNWGLFPSKSGLVVIDVDAREGGLELWAELSRDQKITTMTQRSGRGGLHLLFKARPHSKYRKPLSKKGIDTQWNNIIVIFPSSLNEGQQYTWIDESSIQDLPEKFEEMFAAVNGESQEPVDFIGIDKFVEKLVVQLKDKSFGYDEWVQLGMAIHSSLPDQKGLALWKEMSSGKNFKEGDLEACEYKWSGFSSKGGMTVRSLAFLAREHGCVVPSLTLEQDKMLFATEYQRRELEAEQNPGWFTEESGRIVTVHKDFLVEDLNRQGYFLEAEANAGKIGKLITHDDQYKLVTFMKPADFALQTATHFFKEYVGSEKTSKAVYTKVSKIWIESKKRQSYDRIIFAHDNQEGCLNLWSPLPCTPIPGDVSLFMQLIFDGLADGNIDKAIWLLDWLAHLMQKPSERCSLVPVLIGDQGTGKGMLFDRILKVILGHFHNKIMTARTLKERFNAEQACKLLTFIDEATWRGDKEEDGILKSLTGSKQMTVEQKFGGRYAVDNYSRYAIASNNPEAVSIERSNRRYVIFEANPRYSSEHAFFNKLSAQLDKGQLASHILDHLLKRDIKAFNPHKLPQFDDGQGHQAKVASEGVEAEFWNSLFNHDPVQLWMDDRTLLKKLAFDEFQLFAGKTRTYKRGLSPESFWRKTYAYFGLSNPARNRIRVSGRQLNILEISPKEARDQFSKILGLKSEPGFDANDYIFTDVSALENFLSQ